MSHVEHQLGPFAPPKEYQFEPELLGKLPRIIPPELRQGPHGISQYNTMRGCLIVGLLCVALAETSFVQTVGMYFLPLKFLRWIGAAVLAGALFHYVKDSLERGPYSYVKRGTPYIARVVQMVCQPTMYLNGNPHRWKIFAALEYPQPDGTIIQEWSPSFDLGSQPSNYTTSFKVGDYVTCLHLPEAKPDEQRRVYGFLGLKPGLGVVTRDPSIGSLAHQLKLIAGVFGVLGGIFWVLIYGLRTIPYEMPGSTFWLVNLLVTCLAAIPLHRYLVKRADAKTAAWLDAQNAALSRGEVVFSDAGGVNGIGPHNKFATGCVMFLVLIVQVFGLWTVNAMFDRSTPEPRPAYIDKLIHTTWNGCIRDYSIKWHMVDPNTGKPFGREQSYLTTASHQASFLTRDAVAHVGKGALGWAWIADLSPWETQAP